MGMPGAAFNRRRSHCLPGGLIENLFKSVFYTYSAIFCSVLLNMDPPVHFKQTGKKTFFSYFRCAVFENPLL